MGKANAGDRVPIPMTPKVASRVQPAAARNSFIHRPERDRRSLRTLLPESITRGCAECGTGVVVEEPSVEVMAQLPDDRARKEVMALAEARGWIRGPGATSGTLAPWRRSGRRSGDDAGSSTCRTPQ